MSALHPIVAVTGSSGAGTKAVRVAFEHICRIQLIEHVLIGGAGFHRYDRQEMPQRIEEMRSQGRGISHFGPEANLFGELEAMLQSYGESGSGRFRRYLHSFAEAEPWDQSPGTFTAWEDIPAGTDLLLYEGLHGGAVVGNYNMARHVDLLLGVVPIFNLEWIQKIHRDMSERGYSAEAVKATILRRLHDYVYHILPQFARTDINFQRVPVVDTSNPFVARDVPTTDESYVVIRLRQPERFDFPYLLSMIHDSFMSRYDTIVIPGGKLSLAMELILMPLLSELMEKRRAALQF